MRKWRAERGFTLVEIVLSILIIGIVLTPLLNFFVNSNRLTVMAKKESQSLAIAQGIMEDYLGREAEELVNEGPTTYPGDENYNYEVTVTTYDAGLSLKQIEVEVYRQSKPEDTVKLVSMKWTN